MTRTLADRLAPWAALLIAVLLGGAIVRFTLTPLLATDPEIDAIGDDIARFERMAGDGDRLRRALNQAPVLADERTQRLDQPTDALALADLQTRLTELAQHCAVAVTAAEPLPAPDGELPGRVLLRLDLSGSLAGVQAMVHDMESGTPVMVIQHFEAAAHGLSGMQTTEPPLIVHMTVAAWRSVAP